ncbi:MAG TPA: FG-GAP-like repeat-containing protein [Gemmatimonadaceae bacterium]|nr:FG-GAP-like repeat-containing protein [Gemmatimonadaceae bacterium]
MRQPVQPARGQPLVATSTQLPQTNNPWANGIAITPNLASTSSPDGNSLIWHNSTTGNVTLLKMNGATWSGEKTVPFNLQAPWRLAATADMNKDGHPDLVWENTDNGLRAVVFMNGTKYNNHYTFIGTVSPSTRLAATNDINGDGNPDIIWSNDATGDHSVWYMNGTTNTSSAPLLNLGPSWKLTIVADMNGDNKPDMVWEQSGSGLRAITFMNGATYTGQYSIFAGVDTTWHLATAADFNADGSNDLMWQNSGDGSRVITFMTGPVWNGQYAQFAMVTTAESIVAAAPVQWISRTTFLKLVTFGDSNTDLGFLGVDPAYKASAYVSPAPNPPNSIRLGPNDPNNPLQLAGKVELRWNAARTEVIRVVNHGIAATTTGTGRTGLSSPNALEVVGGFTRFEGEVLGRGYPWSGGETMGSAFPSGSVARVQSFAATSADYAYVSLGTNDIITLSVPTIIANFGTMIDLWTAAGLPANHFIITTLPPREPENSGSLPALNAAIRTLASTRGLRLIDLAALTSADDGLTWRRDTLHTTGNALHYAEEVRDWAADQLMTILTGG